MLARQWPFPHCISISALLLLFCGGQATASTNLLPNSSFELGLGEGLPTHWLDYQNHLTLKLTATGQVPGATPTIEPQEGAPDGKHVIRVPVAPDAPGHTPSPVVKIQGAQAYTLSVFARAEEPSAKIRLTLWTRRMDFDAEPDAFSSAFPLSKEWRRYEFSFVVEDLMDMGVVDLVASGDKACDVWLDAVQLEEGGIASSFAPRFPVEGIVYGKRSPIALHFMNEPLVVFSKLYNSTTDHTDGFEIRLEDLFTARHLLTRPISEPAPPGLSEHSITLEKAPLGRFRARIFSAGVDVGADDYPLIVHPVMDDDFQAVLYSENGAIGQVPAERVILDWTNKRNWYADPPQNLVITTDDIIYVPLADGEHLAKTTDGGRTWKLSKIVNDNFQGIDLGYAGVGFLRDGTFLRGFWNETTKTIKLHSSRDEGKSWKVIGKIPDVPRVPQLGPVNHLSNGALIWPIHYERPGIPGACFAYSSRDLGATWSRPYPVAPGGEPTISELKSGKLIALTRHNPPMTKPEYRESLPLKNYTAWRFWQRHRNGRNLTSYTKRVFLAGSENGGTVWKRIGPASLMLGEMHGGVIDLLDGRLLLHHTHRFPILGGGEWGRVSRDDGRTWENRIYYLTATRSYPGYASMCVLPPRLADGKPGMVLSLVGERGRRGHPPRMQAIRWRPAD